MTIPAKQAAPKEVAPADRLDLSDALLILGVLSTVGGLAVWSKPLAFVVFGLMCLAAVWMMSRYGIAYQYRERKKERSH